MVGLAWGLLWSPHVNQWDQTSRNKGKEMEGMAAVEQQQGGEFNLQVRWRSFIWGVLLDKKNIAPEISWEHVQIGTKMIILYSF